MARPTKLTPEVSQTIVTMLKAGNIVRDAHIAAGIDEATYYRWMKRGRTPKGGVYHDFMLAVTKAQGEASVRNITLIANAASRQWKAAAWLQARRDPEHWGKRETVTHQIQQRIDQVLELVEPHMSHEAYAELIRALAVVQGISREETPADQSATKH